MAAADSLVDYKMVDAIHTMQKSKLDGWKKSKVDGQRHGMVVVPKSGENVQQTSKWVGRFICQGPHQAKDFPKKEKVCKTRVNLNFFQKMAKRYIAATI